MKKGQRNKEYIRKSLKFFKDVKYQLIVIALFYITLGIIGFATPIVEANLITSITSGIVDKVILTAIGFLSVVIIEEVLWYLCLLFWQKKLRTKILFNIRKEIVDNI